jgi:transposase
MKAAKFVSSLCSLTIQWLSWIQFSNEESKRTKLRAQAILLSNTKHSINDISNICQSTRKTVAGWINAWERDGLDSLLEKPRAGRTPLLSVDKHEQIIDIVKENPKQIKTAINTINEMFGKTISVKTLKRIIKKTPLVSWT